ncbi:MAG: CHASE2 domain-containing protein, partial [Deltaproteobacteria bacterium]|nr:CHASE2 domain-containing protein [Deltaproteobacteria bacterium]
MVIIDLDEKTLNRYGQWPWPRYRVAELLDKIAAMGPAVTGLDMIFAEPDRTSAGRLLKDLEAVYKRRIAVEGLPDELSDNDRILAETLARSPFVLGNHFHFDGPGNNSEQCVLHPVKVSLLQSTGKQEENFGIPESTGVVCNVTILSEKVGASGFLNFSPDRDGMLRRLPLLIQFNGKVYTSLALATVMKLKGADNLLLKKDGNALRSINYKGTSVPVDRHGRLLIKFRGPKRSHDYVSAADIMGGTVSSERLKGRVALVGTSAAGMAESVATPFGPTYPGVEVHATIIDNLLTGDFISVPGWSNGLVLLLVLVSGVLLSLFLSFRNAISCFVVMLLFVIGLWLATQQIFFHRGLFMGTAFPIASVVCNYIFLAFLKHRSDQKRAEEKSRQSEEKFMKIFMSAPYCMAITRMKDGLILDANQGFEETLGWKREEAIGTRSTDPRFNFWVNPEERELMVEDLKAGREIIQREFQFRGSDGVPRPGIYSSRPIRIAGEACLIFILQDITNRKRLEEERQKLEHQLLQAQKMDAIGQLAGGIAHDFNNMLTVIVGNTELALNRVPPSDRLHESLQDILNAGRRSADLTRQLLAFARKQPVSPKVLDLNDTVAGILKMLQRLIGENINLVWRPGQALWHVKIDPSQVDQLLANLTVNARDAMNKPGEIIIQTSNTICDEAHLSAHPESVPGEYVLLAVSDEGCGMESQTLANIFEPFFTTKKEGVGTGLGLATVYGIVKQNGGFISVDSEPGQGTTFRIYLPRYKTEGLEAEGYKPAAEPQGGTETVLIVEDEESVLNLSKAMLEKLGYKVLAVKGTDHALRLAMEYTGNIDLLLTDVVMPGINGRELAEAIIGIKPGLKCLYMSGYAADVISHQGFLEEGIQFISKPFS